ncbi:MAG: penicillin-binding protein 2 [Candidatus Hydrogenedentota bacterium]
MDTGKRKRYEGFDIRLYSVAAGLMLVFLILAGRMWELQIKMGDYYEKEAREKRLSLMRINAPRGAIYGQHNGEEVLLADTRAAQDLVLVPGLINEPGATLDLLGTLLPIDRESLSAKIDKALNGKNPTPFVQLLVKRDISITDLARIEECSYRMPGVFPVHQPQRRYHYGQTASQVIGYIGEISPDELKFRGEPYKQGDLVGKSGLEYVYEEALQGTAGIVLVSRYCGDRGLPQVRVDLEDNYHVDDLLGRDLTADATVPPKIGGKLVTTLDIGLQVAAEEALGKEVGSIVVLNARNGQVLALASTPTYDPSVFVESGHGDLRLALLNDKDKDSAPMRHRAYQEAYPPGSVFKVVLAIAALQEGLITENTTHFCNGMYRGPGRSWACWRKKYGGHGTVNVVDALAYSCDVFFYKVGLDLGIDKIDEWCRKLGMGEKTGIDLRGEISGLIPNPEWKEALMRKLGKTDNWSLKWQPYETINASIGQGDVDTTPLQNAVMMATVLNGGRRVRPYLNAALQPQLTEPLYAEKVREIVIRGMQLCVEDNIAPSGTGTAARVKGITVIGKTGTAQVVQMGAYAKYRNEEDIPRALRDHAHFVAGVTDREPPLAIAVIVEHGLHGSSTAAPLAKQVVEAFYNRVPEGALHVAQATVQP